MSDVILLLWLTLLGWQLNYLGPDIIEDTI